MKMIGGTLVKSSLRLINLFIFNVLFIVGINSSLDRPRNYISLSTSHGNPFKVLKVSYSGFKLTQISINENGSPGSNLAIGRVTNGSQLVEFITQQGKMNYCRMTSSLSDIMTFTKSFQPSISGNNSHPIQDLYDKYIPTETSRDRHEHIHQNSTFDTVRSFPDNKNEARDKQYQETMFAVIKSDHEFRNLCSSVAKCFDIFHKVSVCENHHPRPSPRWLTNVVVSMSKQKASPKSNTSTSTHTRHTGCNRFCALQSKTARRHDRVLPSNHKECHKLCISTLSQSTFSSTSSSINQNISDTDEQKTSSLSSFSSTSASLTATSGHLKRESVESIRNYTMPSSNNNNSSNSNNIDNSIIYSYDNGNNNNMSPAPHQKSRQKRDLLGGWMVFPGTKWCGDGNIAENKKDLGYHRKADKCCRKHDFCPTTIPGLSRMYGAFNFRPHTISHCRCDRKFRKCLQATDTPMSTVIGRIYFNMVGPQCFKFKEETACLERAWWGACSKWGNQKVAHLKRQRRYLNGKAERARREKNMRKRHYLITNSVL